MKTRGAEMNPEKYTAIAAECYGRMPSGIAESLEHSAIARIAEAIADAVEAEKATARVEWPSGEEWVEWAHSWPSPHQAEAIFRTRTWLRQHAKIVWGEK